MHKIVDAGRNKLDSFAFVIAVCFGVVLCLCFVVSDYGSAGTGRQILLDEKLNPNEAPPASLIRLPGIGISRAAAIVAYRERYAQGAADPPFKSCDDLQKVRGLGPKTVRNIKRWLTFQKSERHSEKSEHN